MIGKLYVGPHERLRASTDPSKLTPARLSEIDYAHPKDIAAIMAAMPSSAERWTNNPYAVDAVPADRIWVLTKIGAQRLDSQPNYERSHLTNHAWWFLFEEKWP